MFKLQVKMFFDAAHKLPDSDDLVTKACANLHGHTYAVKIDCFSPDNKKAGMVVDFKALKNIVNEYDHKYLNDIFGDIPATSENIAQNLWVKIKAAFPFLKAIKVSVCEGYKGEENSSWSDYENSTEE